MGNNWASFLQSITNLPKRSNIQLKYKIVTSVDMAKIAKDINQNNFNQDNFNQNLVKINFDSPISDVITIINTLSEQLPEQTGLVVELSQVCAVPEIKLIIDSTKNSKLRYIEQPLPAKRTNELYALEATDRKLILLSDGIATAKDAIDLIQPVARCGMFKVDINHCSSVEDALKIAIIAEAAGISILWDNAKELHNILGHELEHC